MLPNGQLVMNKSKTRLEALRCCGTVFKVTPNGVENVLHSFEGGSDGADPSGDLINLSGTLYGTTTQAAARAALALPPAAARCSK